MRPAAALVSNPHGSRSAFVQSLSDTFVRKTISETKTANPRMAVPVDRVEVPGLQPRRCPITTIKATTGTASKNVATPAARLSEESGPPTLQWNAIGSGRRSDHTTHGAVPRSTPAITTGQRGSLSRKRATTERTPAPQRCAVVGRRSSGILGPCEHGAD